MNPHEESNSPVSHNASEASFLTDMTGMITEVEEWLLQHNMPEWIESLKSEGYDDLEDLRALASTEQQIFEKLIYKPGHRKKILRVLFGEESLTTEKREDSSRASSDGLTASDLSLASEARHNGPASTSQASSEVAGVSQERVRLLLGDAGQGSSERRVSGQSAFSLVRPKGDSSGSPISIVPTHLQREEPPPCDEMLGKEDAVLLKIIVVGESGCGKTSYIRQLVDGRFSPNIRATVGLDFSEKKFIQKGQAITVQFWDISGQERFTTMTRSYYKGAHGAIVCYDLTRPKSFDMVERWKKDIDGKVFLNDNEHEHIPAVLMGCKRDLEKRVDMGGVQMAKYCAEQSFIGWFETSAKTNYNVNEAAEYLVTEVMKLNPTGSGAPGRGDNVIILDSPAASPKYLNGTTKQKTACCKT